MKYDIYLAGPFFNKEQVKEIEFAEKTLRERGLNVFSPREHFIPDGENLPNDVWGYEVFKMDEAAIGECKCVVAIYHGMYSDSGTAWEIGYAYANHKPILIVCVNPDDEQSIMILNGSSSVIKDKNLLKTFDFESFPKMTVDCEQK